MRVYGIALACVCLLLSLPATAQNLDTAWVKLELKLNQLPQDLYERLDSLESLQKALASAPNTAPKGYINALSGLTFFHLANAQSERGANAVDYWAFHSEVVGPLESQAKKAFDAALADPGLLPVTRAWTHYHRGLLTYEFAEADARADFKAACALGHALACAEK